MRGNYWKLQEAKARLSELVKSSQREEPQQITVRGKQVAVILSRSDFDRLAANKPSFVKFLQDSPLKGINLKIDRDKSPTRKLK